MDLTQESIEKRIATKVYNDCRTGNLSIQGFPKFDDLIRSLKEGPSQSQGRSYAVCSQQGSHLVILQSLASKFVDSEITKDSAMEVIQAHNNKYNVDGDFWLSEERPDYSHLIAMCCKLSICYILILILDIGF